MIEETVNDCGNCTDACFEDCIYRSESKKLKKIGDESAKGISDSIIRFDKVLSQKEINRLLNVLKDGPYVDLKSEPCRFCKFFNKFKSKKIDDKLEKGFENAMDKSVEPKRNDILNQAKSIINGERQGTYGDAEDSFAMIANLWSSYLNKNPMKQFIDISREDVANMMILMKIARNTSGIYKEDNWIDICGYAALGGEIGSKS